MRSGNLFSKRPSAVLDAPMPGHASAAGSSVVGQRRVTPPQARYVTPGSREALEDLEAGSQDQGEFGSRQRTPGLRVRFDGGVVPKTVWGRVGAGAGLAAVLGAGVAGALLLREYVLRDEHFMVAGPASIQIEGNAHLTRPQLLSVFGGDVERSVFSIPMAERRAELERLPWVRHATVMRLLPNRVRVAIVERTPVAFVRQGSQIGLVDAGGVLLDMAAPEREEEGAPPRKAESYSFPVLTGISGDDPVSTRGARMKIYMAFVAALDASGEHISGKLSEVDLSNPEDVKALLPDHGGDVLVHFGTERYLERYRKFEEHLAEWRTQYPKLASVDMRYERQVVLEMAAGTAVPVAAPVERSEAVASVAKLPIGGGAKKVVPPVKTPTASRKPLATGIPSAAAKPAAAPATTHLTTAFPVSAGRIAGHEPAGTGSLPSSAASGVPR